MKPPFLVSVEIWCHVSNLLSGFFDERDEISELNIDLWGDGCEIGGVDHTRPRLRILQDFSDEITGQSKSIAFCFSDKLWLFLLIL